MLMADRRQVPRYHFHGEADLAFPPDGHTLRIALNTLSVKGCRGECKDAPGKGQKCEVRLHWEGKEFQAEAEIMWRNAKSEIGLKFTELDEPHLRLLRNLLSELQVQPLTAAPQEPDKIRY
jgi:PilZ domain